LLNGPTEREVPVSVESLTTVVEKPDDVETWRRYDVAPEEELQLKVEVKATPETPLDGELSEGAEGGLTVGEPEVVKLEYAQPPKTPSFDALTRQ